MTIFFDYFFVPSTQYSTFHRRTDGPTDRTTTKSNLKIVTCVLLPGTGQNRKRDLLCMQTISTSLQNGIHCFGNLKLSHFLAHILTQLMAFWYWSAWLKRTVQFSNIYNDIISLSVCEVQTRKCDRNRNHFVMLVSATKSLEIGQYQRRWLGSLLTSYVCFVPISSDFQEDIIDIPCKLKFTEISFALPTDSRTQTKQRKKPDCRSKSSIQITARLRAPIGHMIVLIIIFLNGFYCRISHVCQLQCHFQFKNHAYSLANHMRMDSLWSFWRT